MDRHFNNLTKYSFSFKSTYCGSINCAFIILVMTSRNSGPNDSKAVALNMDSATAQERVFKDTMERLTPNKVFSHWVEMDKEMARKNSEAILKQVWSGLTASSQKYYYAPISEQIQTGDLKHYISPGDFDLSKPAQTYEIWWTFLPEWRLRRVKEYIVGLLRRYGWEFSLINIKCCEDESLEIEWEIRVPENIC